MLSKSMAITADTMTVTPASIPLEDKSVLETRVFFFLAAAADTAYAVKSLSGAT